MPNDKHPSGHDDQLGLSRRNFLAASTATAATIAASPSLSADQGSEVEKSLRTFVFDRDDSMFHGQDWQTLNPGYWKVENGALRRRLSNYGDRARKTGFPFHASSHGFDFETQYDPSLASGLIYLSHWNLKGAYAIEAEFTYLADRPAPPEGDDANWKMYLDGYGLMGVAIGSKSLMESYGRIRNATQIGWTDDGKLRRIKAGRSSAKRQSGTVDAKASDKNNPNSPNDSTADAFVLRPGDRCTMSVNVQPLDETKCSVQVKLSVNGNNSSLEFSAPRKATEGYVGIASRGLIDFQVDRFEVSPMENQPLRVGTADCLACYPLGDSLKQTGDDWGVRFVGMFASDGKQVEIRVSDTETPSGGWKNIPVCGSANIVNNAWRRNTAIIDVTLPINPADATLYYTIWKDGVDVTADGRVGTDACGPGTALVGEIPGDSGAGGNYVGRLPQLTAPYKLCGLSCHAITEGLQTREGEKFKMIGGRDVWQVRDQPTVDAYRHLEDYDFQVMVWEDDVWYMELVMYPPSTDDAYKIIAMSICGPASRWQMMRHWNVINPGDHDYGMDDVKGPEQIAIRKHEGLGQDPSYMRRNFQIVHHLTTGAEEVDPLENPKKWRAWKMPDRDFTLLVLDSRLWRSSQDVDMWDDSGWDAFKSLYDRTDPTRSLLGEEQFGWLQEWLSTDSSPLIGVTGISGLHTIWTGAGLQSKVHPMKFDQRDRVVADYAGWVKAGADRVLELFGGRDGIVTVYGDVHNGCIMRNVEHRLIECSFGPIGRSGGRGCIPGFGSTMNDIDGRQLEVHALYHREFDSPDLNRRDQREPFYWNFLEMHFDPRAKRDNIQLRLRNLIDPPTATPRGGGELKEMTSQTGRVTTCKLPKVKTLPDADVFITEVTGRPIRGTRSEASGDLTISGLVDVQPGTKIVINAYDGIDSDSQVITTM